jgi:predicted transcriptional regulator
MDNELVNPRLTTKIVGSYVGHSLVGTDQLSELITSVHRTLGQLGKPVQVEETRTPAVPVRRSVHRDYVVCLEYGLRAKTLRLHISKRHGLSRVDYLRRWGLLSDHPLTAPAYSEQCSSTAKALGIGRKAAAEMIPSVTLTAPPTAEAGSGPDAKPTRKRSTRSASKPAIVGEPATFTRQGRSRPRVTSAPGA